MAMSCGDELRCFDVCSVIVTELTTDTSMQSNKGARNVLREKRKDETLRGVCCRVELRHASQLGESMCVCVSRHCQAAKRQHDALGEGEVCCGYYLGKEACMATLGKL